MVSTDREWLHRVDSGPSGLMSQRRGSAESSRWPERRRVSIGEFLFIELFDSIFISGSASQRFCCGSWGL